MRWALIFFWLIQSSAVFAGEGLFPPGFIDFCESYPAECAARPAAATVKWADAQSLVERINVETNAAITYRPDAAYVVGTTEDLYERVGRGDVPSGDIWTIGPEFGDCDDYAVTKYTRLIEAGIPRGNLRFAYVLPYQGEPHLFLVVETDAGQMVLDNRFDDVVLIEQVALERLSLQDASVPMSWIQAY